MDNILTLIAFFVIIFIFGTLASWLLPIILPIIIVFWVISLYDSHARHRRRLTDEQQVVGTLLSGQCG